MEILRIQPQAAPAAAPVFTLAPLAAEWDGEASDFAWAPESDGASAVLPFGICRLTAVADGDATRVECRLRITRDVRLHSLEVRYESGLGPATTTWVPHLRPGENDVIADRVFRDPVMALANEAAALAIVADVTVWPEGIGGHFNLRRAGAHAPDRVAHGVSHWRTRGHVFFEKLTAPPILKEGREIVWAHWLLRLQNADGLALERAASFAWAKLARRNSIEPQALTFDEFARAAQERMFAPDLFYGFYWGGAAVAAMMTQTFTGRRHPHTLSARGARQYVKRQGTFDRVFRLLTAKVITNATGHKALTAVLHSGLMRVPRMAWFQAWFNQARTALGVRLTAQRLGDAGAIGRTDRMLELALRAPTEEGCPASTCFFAPGDIFWIRGTRCFEVVDWYHLPDASTTGFHLLEWHQRVSPDPRIIEFCQGMARFFRRAQHESGAFPTWARPENGGIAVEPDLARNGSTAGPLMMLARLHRIAPDEEILAAAKRAAAFIEREVLPENKWFDSESFYSCAGRPTGAEGPDPHTGVYPANLLSVFWATRGILDLHLATGDPHYLTLARRCLALGSLLQQVFDHPRLSIDTFGGFASMNADAEFNDARQGLFAPLFFDMYHATGEPEFFERGVATLKACFTTMLIEANAKVAPGNLIHFRAIDRGSILENYGHTGRDEVTSGYLSPDWGGGTSLYATGLALADHGQVYVDAPRGRAWGLDRCLARFVSAQDGEVAIEVEPCDHQRLEVVVSAPTKRLLVNGRAAEPAAADGRRFVAAFR